MKTVTVPPAPLSAEQLRLAQIFATMDDFAQEQILNLVSAIAKSRPRRQTPSLWLVKGGGA